MNKESLNLLLLSNSRNAQGEYLVHAGRQIAAMAAGKTAPKALFIPFAGVSTSWQDYTALVQQALAAFGVTVLPSHERTELRSPLQEVDMVLVGGGNTFHLLRELRQRGWLPVLRESVFHGMPYAGWSAGTNLACPTIRTTNDMPIVDPMGLDALGFVPFQINAHYTNELPPGLQAETREQRLKEFLAANPAVPVCALPEGSWVKVSHGICSVGGGEALWYTTSGAKPLQVGDAWSRFGAPGDER